MGGVVVQDPTQTIYPTRANERANDRPNVCVLLFHSLSLSHSLSLKLVSLSNFHLQKIARAYEVLTNVDTRKEYDSMRYNQEAYFQKYGTGVMWQYAPKSDAITVVIVILLFGSILSWFIQKQHWQNVADKLIKAAVTDAGPRDGGTPESKDIRKRALTLLEEREKEAKETNGTTTNGKDESSSSAAAVKKKKKVKLTASEKRKQMEDSIRPIVTELVDKIEDFGAGYHKPTWKDLLVVKLAQMPVTAGTAILWNAKYAMNRARGLELTDDEREVLTRRAVGEINWAAANDDEKAAMIKLDLWVGANMAEWEEQQELKTLSAADQKRFLKLKKKGKSGSVEDWKME